MIERTSWRRTPPRGNARDIADLGTDTRLEEPRFLTADEGLALPRPKPHGRWQAQTARKAAVITADAMAIAGAMVLAYKLRPVLPASDAANPWRVNLLQGAISLPFWIAIFSHYRLYQTRHIASRLQEFAHITHACGAGVLVTAFVGTMFELSVMRGWLLLTLVFAVVCVTVEREATRRIFQGLRRRGRLHRKVLIVGGSLEGMALWHMLSTEPVHGYEVLGFIDDDKVSGPSIDGSRPLGPLSDVTRVVRDTGATGVIVATSAVDLETSNRLARELTDLGIHVELSSALRDIAAERLTLRSLGRYPMVYVEPVRRHGWRALAKEAFDRITAAVILILLAPALAVVALAIRVESPGRVLFRQRRVGRDGRTFMLLKFRTMVDRAEDMLDDLLHRNEVDGPLFKMKEDPRVTRVGRWLRRLSIDELPQLWNVVRGDMSLVGPRPALVAEAAVWNDRLRQRSRVKPGITGLWQVNGRSDCGFESYERLDLYYVENWSLWTDLAIIAKTIPVLLSRRGAY